MEYVEDDEFHDAELMILNIMKAIGRSLASPSTYMSK
jgi:hypothetical protein